MKVIIVMGLLFVLFMGVVYGALTATGNDRMDMSGKIIGICNDKIHGDNNAVCSLLVEGNRSGVSENQNISIIISKNTSISRKYGNTLKNASINDLKPGKIIEIKFSGSIIQSYPPLSNASHIIILN
jgi:hypothetical protein